MRNSYTVVTASAGSGKTYSLVQKILMRCLEREDGSHTIQHILALTFTNKAANEMKERILSWLHAFSAEDFALNQDLKNLQQALLREGTEIPLEELHRRAKTMQDYVLHNYSALNISTIDRFNSKLVRSFSYELGLAKTFALEINPEPYLIEAVDQLLDKIGQEQEISEELIDFVTYAAEYEKRVALNTTLYDAAKIFINDIHYDYLQGNAQFDSEAYRSAVKNLRNRRKIREAAINEAIEAGMNLLKQNNLEIADFAGGTKGSLAKFFHEAAQNKISLLTADKEEKRVESFRQGASAKSKNRQAEIENILPELLELRAQILQNKAKIQRDATVLNALLPLKINQDVQRELQAIETGQDVVLLSKFNVLINQNLEQEPAEFIYEKVGTRFQHYFFDEFQDTSALQWKNILPLRDESLSQQESSFTLVGDPKQAIYRFRGGDSTLMTNILQGQEHTPQPVHIEPLEDNWRSARNIVSFNNALYPWLADQLEPVHREIFGESARQNIRSKLTGRVRVNIIPKSTKAQWYDEVAAQMHEDIQTLLDGGFSFKDITILCRGKADIFNLIERLGRMEITYHGRQETIKTISESGLQLGSAQTLQALIHFLRWELNPANSQFLMLCLFHLKELGRISVNDFSAEMLAMLAEPSGAGKLKIIREKYGLDLNASAATHLNLYNNVEKLLESMSVAEAETDFIISFLETLYGFSQSVGATKKKLVQYWDEEANQKTIQAAESTDAVQLMTVHKSKGLEFPAVLLPFRQDNKDTDFAEWFPIEDIAGLSAVNLGYFSAETAAYDPEMETFNRENRYKNKIDRFSLQYVATTRPVEQLYLYVEEPKTENKLELYDFLTQGRNPEEKSFDFYPEFETQKQGRREAGRDRHHLIRIEELTANHSFYQNVKIATPSRNYQHRNEKVRLGIFLHDLLSKISRWEDLETTLRKPLLDGVISKNEHDELLLKLQSVLAQWPEYFDPATTLLNEREIMISENGRAQLYRPDRLILTPEGILLIDFKTGEPNEKYENQLAQYRQALEAIGHPVKEAKLVYV